MTPRNWQFAGCLGQAFNTDAAAILIEFWRKTMPQPAVRIRDATKNFGRTRVLKEVNLDIAHGEFVGLTGENGAGKTTLIRCILDLCSLDYGSIAIHGVSSESPQSRARLAFLPEHFTPPWFLSGREFIHLMLHLSAVPENAALLTATLEDIGLDSALLDRPVRAYSKGMTQKLGLAACFLARKDLYLLDEPFSGLDPGARANLKLMLRGLKQRGSTLLFTSHSLADVEEICDHMVVLHRGVVEFHGAPAELRGRHGESSLEQAFLKCIETGSDG